MKNISLRAGQGKHQICLHALFCGKDASICIFGGDIPHIGAVAVAVPRKSLSGDESNSASASVICITGHKEDELARTAALRLSSQWLCNVTVSAGIHINDVEKADFSIITKNIEDLMERLNAQRVSSHFEKPFL